MLIDGDGISPSDAELGLKEIGPLGRLCLLRIYRNFSGSKNTAWTKFVRDHGAVARHMPSVARGKNGTDIALAIDAVEILLTRRIDTFVLATNDADFAPLARRIREEGKDVVGFGRTATGSFRNACTRFHDLRALAAPPTMPASSELWTLQPVEAEVLVTAALSELGWAHDAVSVNDLGQHLASRHPAFDCRTYSRRNLTDLLRDLPSVDLIEHDGRKYARPAQLRRRTGRASRPGTRTG